MGSGKGKARRAQAKLTVAVAPVVSWSNFVRDHDLYTQDLASYYVDDPQFPLSPENQVTLLNEMLADMRDMGAISFELDSGIDINEIEVTTSKDYGAEAIVLKERGSTMEIIIYSDARMRMPNITGETPMSSLYAADIAGALSDAIYKLDSSWSEHMKMMGEAPRKIPTP